MSNTTSIPDLIQQNEATLVSEWTREQLAQVSQRGAISESELKQQCVDFLQQLKETTRRGVVGWNDPAWDGVKSLLDNVCRSRAAQGYSPAEVATFVFSFKRPLFNLLRSAYGTDAAVLGRETWTATELIDRMGLYTTEVYQRARDEVIARQQAEMLELSTPVVKLWDGVLALPLIGTLGSARTQVVMETLLQSIVDTGSTVAIIDITGVPTVDTLVAQHLLKTITAARLMGADCIISGIRPQIAQTIVHLGVELGDVVTKANLSDAFRLALKRAGVELVNATVRTTALER